MPNIPSKYPNFAAEMSRRQLDYKPLYEEIAVKFKKSKDTVSNWFTGRAGELPTVIAFYVRDEYFPEFTVDYLFSEAPIYPDSCKVALPASGSGPTDRASAS